MPFSSSGSLVLSSLLVLGLLQAPARADVRLTEFMASNSSTLLDEDGDSSDWIELWNTGPGTVDLAGWHLTDDAYDLAKWTFPPTELQPGQRLVVFASDKNRVVPGRELHTNFKLSAGGEYLALVEAGGAAVRTEFEPAYPPQTQDVSYGFAAGTAAAGYFDQPTPGAANPGAFTPLPDVVFSHRRGWCSVPFGLALENPEPGVTITYTLDGTEPSATNGLIYAAPIPIDGTTIVRAAAWRPFSQPSSVATSTYLFAGDVLAQSDATATAAGFPAQWIERDGSPWSAANGGMHPGASYGMDAALLGQYTTQQLEDALTSIPTVSLVMGADQWFGHDPATGTYGIYANSTETLPDSDWVRRCSAEWIDPATGDELQIDCGVNVQGGSSPDPTLRSQLSLALKFRSEYGPAKLEHRIFPDAEADEFDYLVLDAGNQNSIHENASPQTKVHAQGLRDQFMMDLQGAMGGLEAHGRFVHLFLDGLYWGVYDLHERPDERFAAEYGGGRPEEYDWVKEGQVAEGNSNPAGDPVAPGAWATVLDIAGGGVGPGDTWGGMPAYDALADRVDLAGFADYLLLNFYGGNQDWPQRNWMSTAHSRTSANLSDVNPDLEFVFHSWDAEMVLFWGSAATAIGDGFYDRTGVSSSYPANAAYLFTALRKNPRFRMLLADRAHRMLFNGGALSVEPGYDAKGTVYDPAHPERNLPASLYHARALEVQDAIVLEYARWGNYWGTPGEYTPIDWQRERTRILNDYLPLRSRVLLEQLRSAQPSLYPRLDAPVFDQHGGQVGLGHALTMVAPTGGGILYTLDGTDPLSPAGKIASTARGYTGPVSLTDPITRVRARAFDGAEWSALTEATFAVMLDLHIGELMADNEATVADESGQYEDWLELYNGSTLPADVGGMYLSDDPRNTTKWRIPDGTVVPAGGHVLVWADEDGSDGPLHANFKLSKQGEFLGLYAPDDLGNVPLDEIAFGAQGEDVATGDMPDGGSRLVTLLDPTPGASNLPPAGSTARFTALDPSANALVLEPQTVPMIGQVYRIALTGAPANARGFVFVGSAPSVVDLGPIGVGLVRPAMPKLWKLFDTDAFGGASVSWSLPPSPALVGARVYLQAYVGGAGLPNALVMTIGS